MRLLFLIMAGFLLSAGCLNEAPRTYRRVDDFNDLGLNGTKIAVCDPGHCPAGRYASLVITNIEVADKDLGARIKANIVTNDPNVRAVLDKVISKEVDAGFVYITDTLTERNRLKIIEIPLDYSPLPQYGIAVIKNSAKEDAAGLFIEYVVSKEGQDTFQAYGFLSSIESPATFKSDRSLKGESITVYAASSLTDVFEEIAERFEMETEIEVNLGFGSSGILRGRIEGGAPADVFASASISHVDLLIAGGFIEDYIVFARNRLVIVTPGD